MAYNLLFVCLGNICRSPSAENIMNYLIKEASLDNKIICDSAGTSGYHIGAPPDRRMTAAAAKQGIELRGQTRKIRSSDLADFDLILAMDRENYRDIIYLDREGKYEDKVTLMCNFANNYSEQEVPDPYYGGSEGFDKVVDLLLDSCDGLLEHIVNSEAYNLKIGNWR